MGILVKFDNPEHGWIQLIVEADDGQLFTDQMSYVGPDSFAELAQALSSLLTDEMEANVNWFSEPIVYTIGFRRMGQHITISIRQFPDSKMNIEKSTLRFAADGTFSEICRPFWKAVRDLQGRLTPRQLAEQWHREFPSAAFERLTAKMQNVPR